MEKKKAHHKRAAERVATALMVRSGGVTGVTRDVSASGIFFETDIRYDVGNEIRLTVEFDSPTGKMNLECRGKIVRVEATGATVGVAVKIIESEMKSAAE